MGWPSCREVDEKEKIKKETPSCPHIYGNEMS